MAVFKNAEVDAGELRNILAPQKILKNSSRLKRLPWHAAPMRSARGRRICTHIGELSNPGRYWESLQWSLKPTTRTHKVGSD